MKVLRPVLTLAMSAACIFAVAQGQPNKVATIKPVALPQASSKVLARAEAQAKAEGKNVLVIFHASWCGWCKRLDKFMEDDKIKPIFDDNFVTVKLTVQEDEPHKMMENPGGLEVMDALGGRDAGLPLFAILTPTGKTVVTSMMEVAGKKPANTGFPAADEEIAHFVTMMQLGAPKATPDQILAMKDYLAAAEAARKQAAAKSGGGGA